MKEYGRRIKLWILVALVSIFLITTVSAAPVENIQVVTSLPATIVAGSTYQAHYQFDSTVPLSISFVMGISGDKTNVSFGDFKVAMRLNSKDLDCNESEPGVFTTHPEILAAQAANDLELDITSQINIEPAIYTFDLFVVVAYEGVVERIYFAGGGGGPRLSPTPSLTPTVTPTLAIVTTTPTPEMTPTATPAPAPTPTPMPIPIPRPIKTWLIILGISAAIIIAVVIAYIKIYWH